MILFIPDFSVSVFINFYCSAPMFLRYSVIGALQMSYDDDDDETMFALVRWTDRQTYIQKNRQTNGQTDGP